MRLPDPFTHPEEALGFGSVTLIDNDPVMRDEMANNRVLEVRNSGQYWGIEIPYPELLPSEFFLLESTIMEYKRVGGFIEILLPQYENVRVKGDFSKATIPQGQKGSTLSITVPNLSGSPKAGDLFKLHNHYKVYKITNSSVKGNVITLSLYPDLFVTTTGQEKPVFTGILFQTKLMNVDAFKSKLTADGVYDGITLGFREST